MRVLFGLIVAGILFGMGSILTKAQESSELALQPIPDASLQDSEIGKDDKADLAGCECPYFPMGPYWYGERFEPGCSNPIPVPVYNATAPDICIGECGCNPVFSADKFRTRPTPKTLFLRRKVNADWEPLLYGEVVNSIGGAKHFAITSIDGVAVSSPILVAVFKVRVTISDPDDEAGDSAARKTKLCRVGWECEDVENALEVEAVTIPDKGAGQAIVRFQYTDLNDDQEERTFHALVSLTEH